MTDKKPAGTSWDAWIEEQIREADARGDFTNLPGSGKPLADLDQTYDPDWWAKKLMKREAIVDLPPALELKRKVQRTLETLKDLRDERDVRRTVEALNAEIRKINTTVAEGPATSLAPLDIEDVVRAWRAAR
jgi:hypothetical protein